MSIVFTIPVSIVFATSPTPFAISLAFSAFDSGVGAAGTTGAGFATGAGGTAAGTDAAGTDPGTAAGTAGFDMLVAGRSVVVVSKTELVALDAAVAVKLLVGCV